MKRPRFLVRSWWSDLFNCGPHYANWKYRRFRYYRG